MIQEIKLWRMQNGVFSFVFVAPNRANARTIASIWCLEEHRKWYEPLDWRVRETRSLQSETLVISNWKEYEDD